MLLALVLQDPFRVVATVSAALSALESPRNNIQRKRERDSSKSPHDVAGLPGVRDVGDVGVVCGLASEQRGSGRAALGDSGVVVGELGSFLDHYTHMTRQSMSFGQRFSSSFFFFPLYFFLDILGG